MGPVVVAYAPFGLLVGASVASSANPWAAWLATWSIYGGAAHLAVLDVLAQGSGWATAAAVGLLVNARLAAYAAAMAPEWRSAPAWRRLVAAVMLTDAPWVMSRDRREGRQHYYLGAAVALFIGWPMLVTVGVAAGGLMAAAPVTDLLVPLTLGAVLVPQLRQRPAATVVIAASVSAVLTWQVPTGAALTITAAVGTAAGVLSRGAS
jgi:predicted branched-subunit amino acid permease